MERGEQRRRGREIAPCSDLGKHEMRVHTVSLLYIQHNHVVQRCFKSLKVKSGSLHGDVLRVLERGEKSRFVERCNAIKLDIFNELFNSEVTRQPAETPRSCCVVCERIVRTG